MIGIGNWGCHVDTMFFKGDVKFTITDNGRGIWLRASYGWPNSRIPDQGDQRGKR
mgnify:CR=1 FL=1